MKHREYYQVAAEQLHRQFEEEDANIDRAAQFCAASVKAGRVIHAFGCGHSQMFPMEMFYRAGGLVPVNALLIPHMALFPKAKLSTLQERQEGFADEYLKLENTSPQDTMLIVSVSGRNAAVIDMAIAAREIGMKVVAMISRSFSGKVESRHSSGKLLDEFADVVIDIKCVEGDAALSAEGMEHKFSGTSTVLGMAVVESIVARTIELCVQSGVVPPVYVSSNLDHGDAINAAHIQKYKALISCL